MLPTCALTAFGLTASRAAIAALPRPAATRRSTSASRAESPAGGDNGGRAGGGAAERAGGRGEVGQREQGEGALVRGAAGVGEGERRGEVPLASATRAVWVARTPCRGAAPGHGG